MFAVCPGSNGSPAVDVGLAGVADAHWAAVKKAMAREQPETGVSGLETRGDLRHD
jgi:hypothetical protein